MKTLNLKLAVLNSSFVLAVLLSGCAKELPIVVPDEIKETVHPVSLFNETVEIQTVGGNSDALEDEAVVAYALTEKKQFNVEFVSGNEELRAYFKDMKINATKAGMTFKVSFKLTENFLIAYLNITDKSQLSAEQLIMLKDGKIPLFQMPVEQYGTLQRDKNEFQEETRNVSFKGRNRSEADYVKVPALVSKRKMAGVSGIEEKDKKEIFTKESFDHKIWSVKNLRKIIRNKTTFKTSSGELLNDNDIVFTSMKNGALYLSLPARLSDLGEAELNLLNSNLSDPRIERCNSDVFKAVKDSLKINKIEDCVVKAEFEYGVQNITLIQATDNDGQEVASTTIDDKVNDADAKLIRFNTLQTSSYVEIGGEEDKTVKVSGLTSLKASDYLNKEFLYRRVLIDSPNLFDFTFAGSSGDLDIVKFEFTNNDVLVKRSKPILNRAGTTNIDEEIILKYPAKYYRQITTDSLGNNLKNPRLVNADYNDPRAIAYVSLAGNLTPTTSSALDFYDLQKCFSGEIGKGTENITTVAGDDQELNFTIKTIFPAAANPEFDCAGVYSRGYFDAAVQKNFEFKERVSFKAYKKSEVEEPAFDIPYKAQMKFGYGLFTYSKITPKGYDDNVDKADTEVALPSVFDLSKGKKIVYVLAGIPTYKEGGAKGDRNDLEHDLREKLIVSTKKVIADLNLAFKKALVGTPNERAEDVIVLKLEQDLNIPAGTKSYKGLEIVPKATMGDLDRNYIYYVQKGTANSIIGLGGAHANPRTGAVESASIYLYGGNMKGMIDHFVKGEKAERVYNENMTVNDEEENDVAPEKVANIMTKANATSINNKVSFAKISTLATEVKNLQGRGNQTALVENFLQNSKGNSKVKEMIRKFNLAAQNPNDSLSVMKAFEGNDSTNVKRMEILNRLEWKKGKDGKASKRNVCLHSTPEAFVTKLSHMQEAGYDVIKIVESSVYGRNQVFTDIWAPTVAHEIGHNLGLRHNFISSYDSANFKFSKDDKSKRNYTSVMDYAADDHAFYDGLGPYDVHALRAGYTGLLELKESVAEKTISTDSGDVPVINNRFVSIKDIKSILKDESWVNLTTGLARQLNIKNYLFCSDELAGEMAMCDRFDAGGSATEIVENLIKSYKVNYSMINFPHERKSFSSEGSGGYIGRLFNTFYKIRQFNEELIYQYLFTGPASNSAEDRQAHQAKINDYVRASQKGYSFLLGVIGTPETPSFVDATSKSRFVKTKVVDFKLDENGEIVMGQDKRPVREIKTIMVETKATESLLQDRDDDRLSIRGIEYDKIIAMMAMTAESLGISRYSANSIRVPYTMLESMVMGIETADSPLINTLKQIAKGEQKATYEIANGMRVPLPIPFQFKTNELIRQYALITSVADMDYQSGSATMNPSRSMRILGKRFPVEEKTAGFKFVSIAQGDLKYFPYAADAVHAADIINTGDGMRRAKSSKLAETFVFQIINTLSPENLFPLKPIAPDMTKELALKEIEKARKSKGVNMAAAKINESHASTILELSLLNHMIEIEKVSHGDVITVEEISTTTVDNSAQIAKYEAEMNIAKDQFVTFVRSISDAEIKKNKFTTDLLGDEQLITAELVENLIAQQVIQKYGKIQNCLKNTGDCKGLGAELAKSEEEKAGMLMEMASLENQDIANNSPVFALAFQTINPDMLKQFNLPENVSEVLPKVSLDSREAEIKNNAALMSLLFYLTHPQENQ